MQDIEVLLEVARDLVAQEKLDAEVMVTLLDSLPISDFDATVQAAVRHAQMVAAAAVYGSSAHAAVARFALYSVVQLLEERIPATIGYRNSDTLTNGHLSS